MFQGDRVIRHVNLHVNCCTKTARASQTTFGAANGQQDIVQLHLVNMLNSLRNQ